MNTSKSLYYWFALFALCFIAYQQIIDNIRPNYIGNILTVKYLLGIAPNFFPGIGIPALFVALIPRSKHNFIHRYYIVGIYSNNFKKIALTLERCFLNTHRCFCFSSYMDYNSRQIQGKVL